MRVTGVSSRLGSFSLGIRMWTCAASQEADAARGQRNSTQTAKSHSRSRGRGIHAHQPAGSKCLVSPDVLVVAWMQIYVLLASCTCMVYVFPLPVWPYAKQVALPFLQAALIS